MTQYEELKAEAKKRASKFFAYKLGYALEGNPYVASVAQEIKDFCSSSNKEYFFDEAGNYICACMKQ